MSTTEINIIMAFIFVFLAMPMVVGKLQDRRGEKRINDEAANLVIETGKFAAEAKKQGVIQ